MNLFNSTLFIIKSLSAAAIIMLCFSCSNEGGTESLRERDATIPDTNAATHDKTLVFTIISFDAGIGSRHFNRWHDEIDKTKGNVHLFFDPSLRSRAEDVSGIKHPVEKGDLSAKMIDVVKNARATRLLIFIATHGASSGNFCYEHKNSCGLTEDFLVDTLNKIPATTLKQVLIIPSSCFNKPIMDRFFAKTTTRKWPFSLSYLAQRYDHPSGTQSPADTLIENLLIPFESLGEDEIDRSLKITTIKEILDFNNALVEHVAPEDLIYDLHHVNSPSSPLLLSDFGFDLKLELIVMKNSSPQKYFSEETAGDFLNRTSLPEKFYHLVDYFTFSQPQRKNGDPRSPIDVPIKSRLKMPLGQANLKRFLNVTAVISRR